MTQVGEREREPNWRVLLSIPQKSLRLTSAVDYNKTATVAKSCSVGFVGRGNIIIQTEPEGCMLMRFAQIQ